MEITKDSPGQLGSKVVLELNKITRIGMILLNPKITRTIGFDLKIKYRQTMISCRKVLWFFNLLNRIYTVQRITVCKLHHKNEMWDRSFPDKKMYCYINTDKNNHYIVAN